MFKLETTVLVLVDIQGKLAQMMHEKDRFIERNATLVRGMRALDVPIVWVEHNPEGLGRTVPEVARHLDGLKPVEKNTFSCCGNEGFLEALVEAGRKQILLAGMETHICILLTALELVERGLEVQVVADAVSSRRLENKQNALSRLRDAGVVVTNVETALYELMRDAAHPRFREILKLIK